MNFKPFLLEKVLNGTKTQTRRLRKSNEYYHEGAVYTVIDRGVKTVDRVKWRCGQDYAAAPGRAKCQQGRTGKIFEIRLERPSEISEADARAEGFANRQEFLDTWDTINGKGKRDLAVWVLDWGKREVA